MYYFYAGMILLLVIVLFASITWGCQLWQTMEGFTYSRLIAAKMDEKLSATEKIVLDNDKIHCWTEGSIIDIETNSVVRPEGWMGKPTACQHCKQYLDLSLHIQKMRLQHEFLKEEIRSNMNSMMLGTMNSIVSQGKHVVTNIDEFESDNEDFNPMSTVRVYKPRISEINEFLNVLEPEVKYSDIPIEDLD